MRHRAFSRLIVTAPFRAEIYNKGIPDSAIVPVNFERLQKKFMLEEVNSIRKDMKCYDSFDRKIWKVRQKNFWLRLVLTSRVFLCTRCSREHAVSGSQSFLQLPTIRRPTELKIARC